VALAYIALLVAGDALAHGSEGSVALARRAAEQARAAGGRDLVGEGDALMFEAEPPADVAAAARELLARGGARRLRPGVAYRVAATAAFLLAQRGSLGEARRFFADASARLVKLGREIEDHVIRERYFARSALLLQRALAAAPLAGSEDPSSAAQLFIPGCERPSPKLTRAGRLAASVAGVLLAYALLFAISASTRRPEPSRVEEPRYATAPARRLLEEVGLLEWHGWVLFTSARYTEARAVRARARALYELLQHPESWTASEPP
jgi:hypothetical protein